MGKQKIEKIRKGAGKSSSSANQTEGSSQTKIQMVKGTGHKNLQSNETKGCPVAAPIDCHKGKPCEPSEETVFFACTNAKCEFKGVPVHKECCQALEQHLLKILATLAVPLSLWAGQHAQGHFAGEGQNAAKHPVEKKKKEKNLPKLNYSMSKPVNHAVIQDERESREHIKRQKNSSERRDLSTSSVGSSSTYRYSSSKTNSRYTLPKGWLHDSDLPDLDSTPFSTSLHSQFGDSIRSSGYPSFYGAPPSQLYAEFPEPSKESDFIVVPSDLSSPPSSANPTPPPHAINASGTSANAPGIKSYASAIKKATITSMTIDKPKTPIRPPLTQTQNIQKTPARHLPTASSLFQAATAGCGSSLLNGENSSFDILPFHTDYTSPNAYAWSSPDSGIDKTDQVVENENQSTLNSQSIISPPPGLYQTTPKFNRSRSSKVEGYYLPGIGTLPYWDPWTGRNWLLGETVYAFVHLPGWTSKAQVSNGEPDELDDFDFLAAISGSFRG
ncbi:hypothetical protein WR25_07030 [Diploscapter pachys]|uniref:Uncharacterized protein n=1 Tax=Diploscapter pachys TaxID=2018661 RepID=A0A2A2JS12_9BILA|nr:hypothetical protein WR25_07030 [Diploscapter pachys]